jgi:hypothetical protein
MEKSDSHRNNYLNISYLGLLQKLFKIGEKQRKIFTTHKNDLDLDMKCNILISWLGLRGKLSVIFNNVNLCHYIYYNVDFSVTLRTNIFIRFLKLALFI